MFSKRDFVETDEVRDDEKNGDITLSYGRETDGRRSKGGWHFSTQAMSKTNTLILELKKIIEIRDGGGHRHQRRRCFTTGVGRVVDDRKKDCAPATRHANNMTKRVLTVSI